MGCQAGKSSLPSVPAPSASFVSRGGHGFTESNGAFVDNYENGSHDMSIDGADCSIPPSRSGKSAEFIPDCSVSSFDPQAEVSFGFPSELLASRGSIFSINGAGLESTSTTTGQSIIASTPTATSTTSDRNSLDTYSSRTSAVIGNVQGPADASGEDWSTQADLLIGASPDESAHQLHLDVIWVVLPLRPALQGEYRQVPGWLANGEAMFRQASGDGWLFSDVSGRWMITDHHSKVEMNRGLIRTMDPHYAKLPYECFRWLYWEGTSWKCDFERLTIITRDEEVARRLLSEQEAESLRRAEEVAERAAQAPDTFWVVSPPKPHLQGLYVKVEGRVECGFPVWKHKDGAGWLFSSSSGRRWIICCSEPKDGGNDVEIRTAQPHNFRWPQEISEWKYANGSGRFNTDFVGAIRIMLDDKMALNALANYNAAIPCLGSVDH